MRRLSAAIVVFAVMLVATPASADPPIQERVSEPVEVVLPGADFCGFDVFADVEQKFKEITFTGTRGTWITGLTVGIITGTFTNMETGESVRLVFPGPGFLGVTGDVVVGTGPWLVFLPGQILFVRGRIEFQQGEPVSISGRTQDLCQMLAP